VTTVEQRARRAAVELLQKGWTVIELTRKESRAVAEVLSEAARFFAKGSNEKTAAATPERLEGYRSVGSEYSISPDRVDLNEAFAIWQCNGVEPGVLAWAREHDLHKVMTRALALLLEPANAILEALRQELSPAGRIFQASKLSYMQVNHYTPPKHARRVLMDPHEDGHLLTIALPSAPGLELLSDGAFTALDIEEGQAIVWAGSILAAVTGGRVAPLVHRVVRVPGVTVRQSALCFVNASLEPDQSVWIENETNRGVDVAALTIEKSGSFGLTTVDLLLSDT
jgi:isopenicillin N synthase-like dioxygenase